MIISRRTIVPFFASFNLSTLQVAISSFQSLFLFYTTCNSTTPTFSLKAFPVPSLCTSFKLWGYKSFMDSNQPLSSWGCALQSSTLLLFIKYVASETSGMTCFCSVMSALRYEMFAHGPSLLSLSLPQSSRIICSRSEVSSASDWIYVWPIWLQGLVSNSIFTTRVHIAANASSSKFCYFLSNLSIPSNKGCWRIEIGTLIQILESAKKSKIDVRTGTEAGPAVDSRHSHAVVVFKDVHCIVFELLVINESNCLRYIGHLVPSLWRNFIRSQ